MPSARTSAVVCRSCAVGKARATQPSGRISYASTSIRSVRAVTASTRPVAVGADGTAAKINLLLNTSPYSNSALDLAGGNLRDVAHERAPAPEVRSLDDEACRRRS
ncbi:hypothetical protein AB0K35_04335 [Micromonospora sp. NPDC053740]|uniref:hypothetical protein n=1 Tax=Micromonospora sp. NPDC053740 TaxID=3155173 RepID=UPI00341EC00B